MKRRERSTRSPIYDLSPENAPHSNVIEKFGEILVPALLASQYKVRFEQPIAVSGWTGPNAPQIDVAVISRKHYPRLPTATDAIAFIEISDTTYARDRNIKIPLYVNAEVPSYIVNGPLAHVEFYGSVEDLNLTHGVVFRTDDTLRVAKVAIDVAALFRSEVKRSRLGRKQRVRTPRRLTSAKISTPPFRKRRSALDA